jgi:hypothetical protein
MSGSRQDLSLIPSRNGDFDARQQLVDGRIANRIKLEEDFYSQLNQLEITRSNGEI